MDVTFLLQAFFACTASSTGLTEIVVRGRILQSWRDRRQGRIRELVNCAQCSGFWCGLFFTFAIALTLSWPEIGLYTALQSVVLAIMVAFATSLSAMVVDTWLTTAPFK